MAEMRLNVARGFKMGTMINSVNVPPELRLKRSTGIDWVDEALGGQGFTPTCTMMLTGGPGTGKSTLLRQLASAMTSAGHIAVLNSGEESIFQIRMSCERLKLPCDFMIGEETMLPVILNFLDNVKAQNPGKQICYLQDSLQCVDDGKYINSRGESRGTTGKTPGYCAESIVSWTQANFGVSIFIGQVNKSGVFSGENKIKHAVDIHSHMYVDNDEKSETYGSLLFDVQKNRWGVCGRTYQLKLTDTGVVAEGCFSKIKG